VIRDFSKAPEIAFLDPLFLHPTAGARGGDVSRGRNAVADLGLLRADDDAAHATFAINTVNHMFGTRRLTPSTSRGTTW